MTDKLDAIARAIKGQHAAGEGYSNLTGDLEPADVAEAYKAQARLHELHAINGRGGLGGRKIALASKVQQELCGVDHPIAGGIFADEIVDSPASISLSDYHGLGIEFEMAMRIGQDIGVDDGPFDQHSIREVIASVHPAFELIIDRKADYSDLSALTMIADNAWCAGVVLGPEISNWRDRDLDELTGTLSWGSDAPVSARTGDADPLGSLAWVVNLVTEMGQTMHAGDVVITGSVIKTRYPAEPVKCRYEMADASSVELSIN